MTSPDLWGACEASWPAASQAPFGPFIWREGAGGGSRVSAATAQNRPDSGDLDQIEQKFAFHDRDALFQLRDRDRDFDALLAKRGYALTDPTLCMTAPVDAFDTAKPEDAYSCWPPIATQKEIWRAGGIDAARLNVMKRVTIPKTTLLARDGEAPAGTAFVAALGSICVMHALEVLPKNRRKGMGRALMSHAATWAKKHNATTLAVLVTRANTNALTLYSSLGMHEVDHYHYRRKGL
jgi:GNAT superfamily N-acetyltransferase